MAAKNAKRKLNNKPRIIKQRAKLSLLLDGFIPDENAYYGAYQGLFIVFLSGLFFSYFIYSVFAGGFDILSFTAENNTADNPGLLTVIVIFTQLAFGALLYWDKKRVSVLIHHAFCAVFLNYIFLSTNSAGWAEYESPSMTVIKCLLLALFTGWLLDRIIFKYKKVITPLKEKTGYVFFAFLGFYSAYFIWLSLTRHYMFYSQTYDLAWEHQVLHMLATTGFPHSTIESIPGINNWADHTSFIYYLLAPFYLIFRNVEFMLVTQVLAVTGAAWLLYAYAKKALNSTVISVILAFAFLMHPSVQGYLLEDFHPSVMALPLFFGFLLAVEKKNFIWMTVSFTVMALVREDIAFFSFFCALYFIVSKKVTLKQGLILQGISVAVMALMMGVMHYAGGDAGSYDGRRFYTLGSGFFGVIQAIITNPVFVFSEMFTADKLGFLLLICAPLLFIFFPDAAVLIMLIPASVFGVLSAYYPHYILGYHYSVFFICGAFLGAVTVLSKKKMPVLIFGAIITMAFLMNFFYGNMFSKSYRLLCTGALLPTVAAKPDYVHKNWTGYFRVIKGEKDPQARAIMRAIPEKYRVCADFFAAPHVSGRRYVYQISGHKEADIVINRKGQPPFENYVLLKSTVLWDFYAKKELAEAGSLDALMRRGLEKHEGQRDGGTEGRK